MARRPRLFAPGLLYHVIVRGNQRRKTFLGEQDYQAYLERLSRYRQKYRYTIHAYCLMPNHVHLLVESSEIPLGKYMQGVQQSYSQYFNLQHRKVGHVFQGRYKAIVCDKEPYLLELTRYIHLNPVRAGIVREPGAYPYSGHRSYAEGKATELINPRKILKVMGGPARYRAFVRDGLGAGHKSEYYEVEDQRFLGEAGFGEKLQEEHEGASPAKRRPLEPVIKTLSRELAIGVDELQSADRSWPVSQARITVAYTAVRRLGYPLREIAEYFRRDPATVSILIGRLAARMSEEKALAQQIEELTKKV